MLLMVSEEEFNLAARRRKHALTLNRLLEEVCDIFHADPVDTTWGAYKSRSFGFAISADQAALLHGWDCRWSDCNGWGFLLSAVGGVEVVWGHA